jgi:hypothetical protein
MVFNVEIMGMGDIISMFAGSAGVPPAEQKEQPLHMFSESGMLESGDAPVLRLLLPQE